MLQGRRKSSFLFFVFGFVLLFCRLLCLMLFFNGAALVSWFQWWSGILVVQLTIIIGSVNHDSGKWLVLSFQGNRKMWMRKNYMKLAEEEEGMQFFGSVEEVKFWFFKLWSVELVWILDSNQLGMNAPLDFLFSWTLIFTVICFLLCHEWQEGSRRLRVCM
jgi:hypothetical protein